LLYAILDRESIQPHEDSSFQKSLEKIDFLSYDRYVQDLSAGYPTPLE
jgi:hypothetical protein